MSVIIQTDRPSRPGDRVPAATGPGARLGFEALPIDTLKVDRSFIRDIPSDSGDMEITRAIIAMAHSLKLKIVAKGVETADQLRFLQAQRGDAVQGYFLFRPVPEEQVAAVLELNRLDREARLTIPLRTIAS